MTTPAAPEGATPPATPPAGQAPATPPVTPPVETPATPPVTPPTDPPATPPATPPADPPAAPPAAPVAPVTYELTLPADAGLDDADVATVTTLAKEHGWTNEQAQAALNRLGADLTAQRSAFRTELEAHPEIGGAQLAVALEQGQRVLDRFLAAGTPEGDRFRKDMDKSGYGNYAPFALLLSRIGKAMGEDTTLTGGRGIGAQPGRRSHADVLFGDAK